MTTVYITWIHDGIPEDSTEVHDFNSADEYEEFAEMHWRCTSTTSPEMFEQMSQAEKQMMQAIWEEVEAA